MAKYSNTKKLKKAKPRIRKSDGIVMEWELELHVEHTRADGTVWSTSYPYYADVEFLNKAPTAFTKAELIGLAPPNIDVIFDAHYEAHNTEATDEVVSDFDINSLT